MKGITGAKVAIYHANDLLHDAAKLAEDAEQDAYPTGYARPATDPARLARLDGTLKSATDTLHDARMCLEDEEHYFTPWKNRYNWD